MDPSRFKRPGTQTPRQTNITTFGNPPPVPKVLSTRPLQSLQPIARPIMPGNPPLRRMVLIQPNLPQPAPLSVRPTSAPAPTFNTPAFIPGSTPQPTKAPNQLGRLAIDMELPGEDSPSRLQGMLMRTKWRGVRRWAFRGVAVGLVLMITVGGILFSQSYSNLHKVFNGTGTVEALKANVNPYLLKGEGSGRVNILLMGRGGGNHDGPDLTDSMMVASVDPVNHTTTLLSLPRDLWVNVPNQGDMKLNAAWETGEFKYLGKIAPGSTDPKAITAGFTMVDQTVENVLGINIDYNALVDFQAFQQAVDTVSGVTVNVPTPLVDPTMAWQNGNNATLAQAGVQNFNGAQALLYVRSRETSSDFARAQRQRAVLVALKSKVVSLGTLSNPLKISGLLNEFGNNVQTDLTLNDASRLYDLTKGISDTSTGSVDLAGDPNQTGANQVTPYVTTGNMNGQSIVLPTAGLFNYSAIQQFVRGQLKDPYLVREDAKVLVLNGTTVPGLATTKADELKSYGYNVIGASNTPNTGWTQTTLIDLSHGKDKYTAHYLAQRLGVTAQTAMPDNTIPTNGADFVIIVGSDEANLTQPPSN